MKSSLTFAAEAEFSPTPNRTTNNSIITCLSVCLQAHLLYLYSDETSYLLQLCWGSSALKVQSNTVLCSDGRQHVCVLESAQG